MASSWQRARLRVAKRFERANISPSGCPENLSWWGAIFFEKKLDREKAAARTGLVSGGGRRGQTKKTHTMNSIDQDYYGLIFCSLKGDIYNREGYVTQRGVQMSLVPAEGEQDVDIIMLGNVAHRADEIDFSGDHPVLPSGAYFVTTGEA
jgi:hypothetical protein